MIGEILHEARPRSGIESKIYINPKIFVRSEDRVCNQ